MSKWIDRIPGIVNIVLAYFLLSAIYIFLRPPIGVNGQIFYYLKEHLFILYILIYSYRLSYRTTDKIAILTACIFEIEYSIFNVCLIGTEGKVYHWYVDSKNWCCIFVLSIIGLLFLFKRLSK